MIHTMDFYVKGLSFTFFEGNNQIYNLQEF